MKRLGVAGLYDDYKGGSSYGFCFMAVIKDATSFLMAFDITAELVCLGSETYF